MTAVVVTSERSQSPARFPWGISKLGLLIMVCAQFLVGLDAAIATIAMPTMERELSVNAASIQWTVIGYMVACAAVAVPVGALGDRIGKRPVYVAGLGAVLAGSIICTLSGSNWVLVTGRAIGGCGAAATTVMTLAILTSAVSADLVPKVVGMWAALSSSATCLAPMLSGLLVQTVGWRLMFGIDVIPLIVIMILARWTVPNTERATATRMGGLGLGLMVASVLLVAGGLSRSGGNRLLSAGVLLPVVAGLLVMVAFVYQQRRTAKPLTDWKVIGQYPIPAVLVLLAALGLALTGSMFQEMMLLQKAFDYSPLLAGSLDVGPAVIFVVCAALTSRISARFGVARTVAAGLFISGCGVFGIAVANTDPSPLWFVPWFLLMGVGMGLAVPTLNATAIRQVSSVSRGAVSGFLSLSSQLSAVLGIALLGGIAASATRVTWLDELAENESQEGAVAKVASGAIANINDNFGVAVGNIANLAYQYGVIIAMSVGALGLFTASVVAAIWLRGASAPRNRLPSTPTT